MKVSSLKACQSPAVGQRNVQHWRGKKFMKTRVMTHASVLERHTASELSRQSGYFLGFELLFPFHNFIIRLTTNGKRLVNSVVSVYIYI